jgi:hypothetical protein
MASTLNIFVVNHTLPAIAYPALDLHVLESLFMNKLWAPIDRRKAYPALVLRGI